MKCYRCDKMFYRKYPYCPYCGGNLKVCSKKSYMITLHDAAQMNRVENKLDWILKKWNEK